MTDFRELIDLFIKTYGGTEKGIRVFRSPGRVNLIGEHTDYNGGYVFPAALTMATTVIARPREDKILRLMAADLRIMVEASLDELDKFRGIKWGNYQLGVADELQKAGYMLTGCDLLFEDKVPLGSGLSSSAAIEIACAIALVGLGDAKNGIKRNIDMIEMAKIAQVAEHNYVGVKCGIMDQFASAMGKRNKAIFLNCKNLDYELVPLDIKGYKIVLSNTKKKRSLGESKYNERRSQCEDGFRMLQKAIPTAQCLGDISPEEYEASYELIGDRTIRNRVEHVIYEDDRVLQSVSALRDNDIEKFGKLMVVSHNSLRDLYEVTGKELDTLVEAALSIEGVIGSRMTGAGFGGCTVSIVQEEQVESFISEVGRIYKDKIGHEAAFYVSEIGDGGKEISF